MLHCEVDHVDGTMNALKRSHLLDWLKAEARAGGCAELQLISRVTREQAHRFYFREGLGIECFQFRTALGPAPAA